MTFAERIRKLRKSLDITQQEFAARIGVKRNTVATYEMGRSVPSDAALSLICREFGVSEAWLRSEEGEMFAQKSRDEELREAVNCLLADESPEFRQKLVIGLSRLSDGQWDYLEEWLRGVLDERQATESRPAVPVTTMVRDGQEVIRGMTRAEYHAQLDQKLDAEQEEDRQRIQALPQSGKGISGNGSLVRGPSSTGTGGVA